MSKILVVDDEKEICEFLREFFTDRHYEVFCAYSGEAALEVFMRERPQVVLLDMIMPGIDGLQALKELKSLCSKVKVIMVTAVETVDKMDEAFILGADNYITKPLSLEYLEADVKEKILSYA